MLVAMVEYYFYTIQIRRSQSESCKVHPGNSIALCFKTFEYFVKINSTNRNTYKYQGDPKHEVRTES
jgi:hypothetical protein